MAGRIGVTVISSSGLAIPASSAAPDFTPRVISAPVPAPHVQVPQAPKPPKVAIPAPRQPVARQEEEEPLPGAVDLANSAAEDSEEELAVAAEPEREFAAAAHVAQATEEEEQGQVSLIDVAPIPERPAAEAHPAPAHAPRMPRVPRQPRILSAATDPQPPAPTAASRREVRQETLQFEPVTRGRFEKSEPTIVDGQDLDVPTFLRRNVKVS